LGLGPGEGLWQAADDGPWMPHRLGDGPAVDGEHQDPGLGAEAARRVELEVAHAVVDVCRPKVAAAEQDMGVLTDDDVGPGFHEVARQGALDGRRTGRVVLGEARRSLGPRRPP